jgi:hypothetical protein
MFFILDFAFFTVDASAWFVKPGRHKKRGQPVSRLLSDCCVYVYLAYDGSHVELTVHGV